MLRASWIAVFLLAGCNAAQGPTVDRDTGVDAAPDADATLADTDADADANADADADADTAANADADADADADPDADAYADPDADAYADPDADAADADADLWPGTIVCEASDAAVDAAPGTTFCEIYVDVFSPTGSAKCQSSGCHGGGVGINGLAMGWTGKSCYDALTTHDVPWLPPHRVVQIVDGGDSRPGSLLPSIVDPAADAGLLMPFPKPDGGNRLLDDSERARIDAWLSRGAPFD